MPRCRSHLTSSLQRQRRLDEERGSRLSRSLPWVHRDLAIARPGAGPEGSGRTAISRLTCRAPGTDPPLPMHTHRTVRLGSRTEVPSSFGTSDYVRIAALGLTSQVCH